MYELPKFELPKLSAPKFRKHKIFWLFILTVLISLIFGLLAGSVLNIQLPILGSKEKVVEKQTIYIPQTSQEEATINVVKEYSPAVVSIVITKDVPIIEEYYTSPFDQFFNFQIPQYRQNGTQKQEVGGGTGFFISEDGLVMTNAHVVSDKEADYTVLTNDGKKYPASVLATDTIRDLGILKVEQEKTLDSQGNANFKPFPTVKLGDSDKLQIGQTVIAIGNALGEFRNTISVGVVSGLGRTVTASGGGTDETLEDIIQTDAAINLGNSGGPLLNLKGEVIGVNFATAEQAQSIGFAIPINNVKKDIEQVKTSGKIVYPFLGVRYILINETVQTDNKLPVGYGAWVQKGSGGEPAVSSGSVAEKAGIKEGDIILEFNGEKITTDNALAKLIMKYNPGDKVTLKILRDGKEQVVELTLGERTE